MLRCLEKIQTSRPCLQIAALRPFFSEFGLIKYRMLVEVRWLQALSRHDSIPEVPQFSADASSILDELCDNFTVDVAAEVKQVERTTNHDVKAVEYVLREKMATSEELTKVLEFTHFACTSEDINNLSHALMLKESLDNVILPAMDQVIEALTSMAEQYAGVLVTVGWATPSHNRRLEMSTERYAFHKF